MINTTSPMPIMNDVCVFSIASRPSVGPTVDSLASTSGAGNEPVLSTATREAAQLLGVGDVGTIEEGKLADLVLLDADPLEDVGAYAKVSLVVQAGRLVVAGSPPGPSRNRDPCSGRESSDISPGWARLRP